MHTTLPVTTPARIVAAKSAAIRCHPRKRVCRHPRLRALAFAAAIATPLGSAFAQEDFFNRDNAAVNFGPGRIVSGDFNRDGRIDLATLHRGRAEVSTLNGNGDGTLSTATTLVVPAAPLEFFVTDFSRDAKEDMVIAGATSSLSRGNGTGGFGSFARTDIGTDVFTSAIGDFNEDGRVDLITITGPGLRLLTSTGVRVNLAGAAIPANAAGASIVSADFNGDGHLDVAFTRFGQSTTVGVMFGNGDGTFQSMQVFITGEVPIDIVTADLNRDGFPDLATTSLSATRPISILLNDRQGRFLLPKFARSSKPDQIAIEDMDRNGTLDLVILSRAARRVELLRGNGDSDATFAAAELLITLPALSPAELALADLNQDSFADIAVSMRHATDPNRGQISTYLNPGTNRANGFTNMAARVRVQRGATVQTGFVIEGSPTRVLIRAIGPGLEQFGIRNVLPNPSVTVFLGANRIAGNDDWSSAAANRSLVEQATADAGTFTLPVGSKDAATVLTLEPGTYVVVTGAGTGESGDVYIDILRAIEE